MQIGRRIYYELNTGTVFVDISEREGNVIPTTPEQDFQSYPALAEQTPETVGVIELAYGERAEEFEHCLSFSVNLTTGKLEIEQDTSEGGSA